MKNQFNYSHAFLIEACSSAFAIASLSIFAALTPAIADLAEEGRELPKEREIHNTFSRDQKNGSIIDATNPMDLINRLRQATALDNATRPSDAIDDALKALESYELESPSSDVSNPANNLIFP